MKDKKDNLDPIINFSFETHFSAQKCFVWAIQKLLKEHPYHRAAKDRDFTHAISMILISMQGCLSELISEQDKLFFDEKSGLLCKHINDKTDIAIAGPAGTWRANPPADELE